jgi:hypothetical protein
MWGFIAMAGVSLVAASLAFAGQPSPDTPAWRAELKSSGGFTGRGMGGVVVQADGAVSLLHFGVVRGQKDWETLCTVRLPEKIKPIAEALQASQTETWRERYLPPGSPDGCCDQLQWELDVTRTAEGKAPTTQRTSWIGDAAALPENLARLRTALMDAWKAAKPVCGAVR